MSKIYSQLIERTKKRPKHFVNIEMEKNNFIAEQQHAQAARKHLK